MGLANQTTMLRDETLSIGKLLEKTMMEKYGPAALKEHYMVMDTICDATQVRLCLRWCHTAGDWLWSSLIWRLSGRGLAVDCSLGCRPPAVPHSWVEVVVLDPLG